MRRHFLFLAVLAFAACSHKTPDQQLLAQAGTAASWVATLQFAGEKWLANSVSTAFVRATAAAAEKAFDKTDKAIAQSQARKQLRDDIRRQLEIAQAAAGDLKQAMETNDRRAVTNAVRRFAAAGAELQRLEQQKESS